VDDPRIKPGREPAVPLQLCAQASNGEEALVR
jgi:hypothetical protein